MAKAPQLSGLKQQGIIIVSHDFVGQEFAQGTEGMSPLCSCMFGAEVQMTLGAGSWN